MKVLVVIPYISFVYGGTARVVKDIAYAVGKQNIQVDIVTTNADGEKNLDVCCNQWILEPPFRVQYFSCWHRYDLVFSFSMLRWLEQHVDEYDLVHTHTLFAPMLSWLYYLCRRRCVPYLMTPHGMLDTWALAHKANKKSLYLRWIEKRSLSHASTIQALTRSEVNSLASMGLSNVSLVPNGINWQGTEDSCNPKLFYKQFPETEGKKSLLFLGRIDPKKGLKILVEALAKVRLEFTDVHLIIAGPDSIGYSREVKQHLANLNCLDVVTFTGMLEGKLKQSALATATLFTLPSYSEGFSIAILEAMALGLPCIITTGCNFPEAAEANAAYVVEPNPAALAHALIHCLSDRSFAKITGDRARQLVLNHYTWDRIATQLIDVYIAILNQKNYPHVNPSEV